MSDNPIADWRWRFNGNLYWIKPADARSACKFVPRPKQWEILEDIYVHGNMRLAILKSRQLGFSTLLSLVCLDFLLFRRGVNVGVVDQTADDAEKKRLKIKFAWDMLPEDLRDEYRVVTDSFGKFSIRLRKAEDRTRSLYAGKNPRGDTHQLLWISEWGPIQVEDPNRSDKIADGGLPSVEHGLCVIETTWRGGKTGRLWTDVVDQALQIKEEHRVKKDWQVRFYPWYLDPELVWEGSPVQITDECKLYLHDVESHAIEEAQKFGFDFDGFSDAQRLWYYKVPWPKRYKRYEEYPTVMDEMFLSPSPGAIYTEEMTALRTSRRLTTVPVERAHKVIVSFDLGRDDAMPMVFSQLVGHECRVVDYHTSNRELVDYYVSYIVSWCAKNNVASVQIVLPHDSRNKGIITESSVQDRFIELGRTTGLLWEVTTVDVIGSIWDGIDDVRKLFPYVVMDSARCSKTIQKGDVEFPCLVDCLERYRCVEMQDGRNTTREPIHDRYCHGADAFRTLAEGIAKGRVSRANTAKREVKVQTGFGVVAGGDVKRRKPRMRGGLR